MSATVPTLVNVVVPTLAEFNTLSTKVTALQTSLTDLTNQHNALVAEVLADEKLIAALQVAPPILPPPIIVPPPPVGAGLLFASEWASGTPKDNWDTYDEWTGGLPLGTMMSVVPGFGPGGRNALKVMQHGEKAAAVQKKGVIPPSTDFYVRFYFRTDDTSVAGDHCAAGDVYAFDNVTYLRKSGGPNDWKHVISAYGCGYVYPVGHWTLRDRLANGRFYRLEYFVHFTKPTAMQIHPRVYDDAGTLLYTGADYRQSDFQATPAWNGRTDWTLDSYYAAGYDFCVHPEFLTGLSLGNNGQAGAIDSGLAWYFAGAAISTVGWIGP